jgi:hypothetical protein
MPEPVGRCGRGVVTGIALTHLGPGAEHARGLVSYSRHNALPTHDKRRAKSPIRLLPIRWISKYH